MIDGREGSSGILPTDPPLVRGIPATQAGLSVAGAARNAPFFVAGDRCAATGIETRDGVRIDFDVGVRFDVAPGVGTGANLVTFPGLVRREFIGPRGSTSEVVLCAPSVPLAVVQWSGSGAPGAVDVACASAEPAGDADESVQKVVDRTDFGVAIHLGDDRYAAVLATPGARVLEVDPEHASIRLELQGPESSLVLCAGSRSEVGRALKAAPHLSGHLLRSTAAPDREGLYVDSGVGEIDEGIAWARARLASVLRSLPDEQPDERLQCGLAALATGDEETARAALQRLDTGDPRHGAFAGRLALALGDAGPATSVSEAMLAGTLSWDRNDLWYGPALDALAGGLHNSAPDLIPGLHELRLASSAAPEGGRRLPVVGGAPKPLSGAERLMRLVDGLGHADGLDHVDGAADGVADPGTMPSARVMLDNITPLFRSDPDGAWQAWRGTVTAGLAGGPKGLATWDDPTSPGLTGALLLAFVHGCLGIGQDAPSGRIRIAPRFPAHLTRLSTGGIRVGGARLRMNYERQADLARYEFVPEFAGVPALLVFEPAVARPVSAVHIDGAPAELDLRPERHRTVVPVQIPLDGQRTVEILLA